MSADFMELRLYQKVLMVDPMVLVRFIMDVHCFNNNGGYAAIFTLKALQTKKF